VALVIVGRRIGVLMLVLNVVAAFAVDEPRPIISFYFAVPAVILIFVVLGLVSRPRRANRAIRGRLTADTQQRTAIARTADSKVGSIAMLGGISVIVVGAVVIIVLTYVEDCSLCCCSESCRSRTLFASCLLYRISCQQVSAAAIV
jgi:predicted PurR-regulated permease PerM